MTLLSYFYSINWANRLATLNATLTITASIVIISVWGLSAGLFHKDGTAGFNIPNIWSWSCNHRANSTDNVNFGQICVTQVTPLSPKPSRVLIWQEWSFICAMIEITLETLTIASFGLIFVRMNSKREIRKTSQRFSFSPAGGRWNEGPQAFAPNYGPEPLQERRPSAESDVKEDLTKGLGSG